MNISPVRLRLLSSAATRLRITTRPALQCRVVPGVPGPQGETGNTGPIGPIGLTGGTGATGAKGDTGDAATIAVGSVSTLTPGSSATVANAGTSGAAVFNFGIPRGDVGATGSTGAAGAAATIAVGTVTTLSPGASATITNVGTSAAAVFNFGIPQGATGASGAGTGDVVGPAASIDGEIALYNATTGKLIKRYASTGLLKTSAGVAAVAVAGTDYLAPAAIGVTVQAYDADLTTWAGLTPSANAQSLVTAANYGAMRTLLGLVIGTDVQAYDADLTAWAAVNPSSYSTTSTIAASYQPLDSDLTAFAGMSTTGLVARTATGTVAARTVTAPAAGITVTNGDGVAGNPTLALADDLAAVEGLSTTGLVRRTGASTWTAGTTVATAEIADDAVTYAKLQNVSATSRILGRITAGAGDTEELTGTQATTLLDSYAGSSKGLVPAGAGSTTKYLREDGAWNVPPGGGGGSSIWGRWTITKTTSGTLSAVNTTTDVVTTGVHGLVTGDAVYQGGTLPGVSAYRLFWVNVLSTTTFTLHNSKATAIAGTSRVDITAAGSGTRTFIKVTVSLDGSSGVDTTVDQLGLSLSQSTVSGTITLTTPMTSSTSYFAILGAVRGDYLGNEHAAQGVLTTTTIAFRILDVAGTGVDWTTTFDDGTFPVTLTMLLVGS